MLIKVIESCISVCICNSRVFDIHFLADLKMFFFYPLVGVGMSFLLVVERTKILADLRDLKLFESLAQALTLFL